MTYFLPFWSQIYSRVSLCIFILFLHAKHFRFYIYVLFESVHVVLFHYLLICQGTYSVKVHFNVILPFTSMVSKVVCVLQTFWSKLSRHFSFCCIFYLCCPLSFLVKTVVPYDRVGQILDTTSPWCCAELLEMCCKLIFSHSPLILLQKPFVTKQLIFCGSPTGKINLAYHKKVQKGLQHHL